MVKLRSGCQMVGCGGRSRGRLKTPHCSLGWARVDDDVFTCCLDVIVKCGTLLVHKQDVH